MNHDVGLIYLGLPFFTNKTGILDLFETLDQSVGGQREFDVLLNCIIGKISDKLAIVLTIIANIFC